MVFSGIPFLYYFLPCILLAYFVVPKSFKNFVLLIASLIFYAWGEPVYVFLMLFSILFGYLTGILLEKSMENDWRILTPGRILAGSVFVFAGLFIYFKYTDFLISNINGLVGSQIPLLKIALPIGISFYTFQIISYLVDVYRKDVPAQKNFISLAAYVSMFPQLIAGPIVRYKDVSVQLDKRHTTWEMAEAGITHFIIGLSKKILIANELGELCNLFRDSQDKSVLFYWLYAIAFMLHIYFDFSGYSDMAIGLGKIFGFTFPENFNYPYIAGSITDFWRRWHMTLGSWFRDYVYIPLGGNRVSKIKWYRNIFVVWMFTGIWHGAAWNFLFWGLYFAVLLILEKRWLLRPLGKSKWFKHLYLLFFVLISFVIFNAPDMKTAFEDIGRLFGAGELPLTSTETMYYLKSYGVTIFVGIIGCMPVIPWIADRIMNWTQKKQSAGVNVAIYFVQTVVLITLVVLSTAYLVDGSFNPFLYFRF